MSVADCSHCKRSYWRYRADYPPAGYYSQACYEDRRKPARKDAPVPTPQEALTRIREHRSKVHGTGDVLAWFDCFACTQLEEAYAAALAWHTENNQKILKKAGRKKKRATRKRTAA